MVDYPLFQSPEWVDMERVKSWPAPVAIRYREWFVSVIESRVDILRSLLEFEVQGLSPRDLEAAGLRAAALLKEAPFSTAVGSHREMAHWGISLATDMGLYVAKCLFDCCEGKIHWITPREHKTDVSYNLPVIAGFGPGRLDPVFGSIAEAHGIILGQRDGRIWKEIYDFWRARA
jgi:hypothetical protein